MLKAFLVEDSPVIRQGLTALLEEMTDVHIVGTADNETTALAWLSGHGSEINLAILDIFLATGSGLGVLRQMATLHLNCKIVVLTNYATHDIREKSMSLGADRVFDKSNDIEALIQYCNELTGKQEGDTTQDPALTPLA